MKNNIKAYELIEKGLSAKTVSKLNESQIETLYKKLVLSEQVTEVPTKKTFKVGPKGGKVGNVMVSTDPNTKEVIVTTENELDETETDDVTDKDALGADALQNLTGQEAPHMSNDMAPDGMDDDSDNDRKMMGMSEEKKKEQNPWAICTAQLGKEFGTKERHLWSAKEKNKYERCVKDVKKSLKEGKNPVTLFFENKIMELLETHLPPKISKKDLIQFVIESEPATKPKTEPKTKPGTKEPPSPVKTPSHPGKNPNPKVNPAPKAKEITPEEAKEKIIDTIIKMLKK